MKVIIKLICIVAICSGLFSCNQTGKEKVTESKKDSLDKYTIHEDFRAALIQADKSVIREGEMYTASIFLGSYNSHVNPQIEVNGTNLEVKNGSAIFKAIATGTGIKEFEGSITLHENGVVEKFPFKSSYQVVVGAFEVTCKTMDVVYSGIENPISVRVPGYAPDRIIISFTGFRNWKGSKGEFMAMPFDNKNIQEATVNIAVKTNDGQVKFIGEKTFRIKHLPEPKIYLGNRDGGEITKIQLSVLSKLIVKQENFPYDGLSYNVSKYNISIIHTKKERKNYSETVLSDELPYKSIKDEYSNLSTGDMVIISAIDVKGPAGPVHINSGPIFTIE